MCGVTFQTIPETIDVELDPLGSWIVFEFRSL